MCWLGDASEVTRGKYWRLSGCGAEIDTIGLFELESGLLNYSGSAIAVADCEEISDRV
jgi:hypothetical protein